MAPVTDVKNGFRERRGLLLPHIIGSTGGGASELIVLVGKRNGVGVSGDVSGRRPGSDTGGGEADPETNIG